MSPAVEPLRYRTGQSLMAEARALTGADAPTLAALAAAGVPAVLARDLGRALDIAPRHFFRDILGTNRSAAEKKSVADAPLNAVAGARALALLRLLAQAEALRGGGPGFDVARWLGRWIEQPHPALAGRTPAAALGEPEAWAALERLLRDEADQPSTSRPATAGMRRPPQ
ncbi:antitoxin Xre/MbcA/ParS toxin-binding domain-containing protein [Azohydromonas aeria]|uniref:antitoxin Xre/MbcA/ParS toxin-binding domain-containing protein n=1 Tax=Azohydromonas aeria TaxID=2590212 RepID=UPI0012F74244|nr:antitoxin Xre/MbcA/ParS toxin-binding domain-containing protein [Azohydromonas aeria]